MSIRKTLKSPANEVWLQPAALRSTRVHFLLIGVYMLSIVIFDSWNLIAHEAVIQRWTSVAILLILNTVFWYLARQKFTNPIAYRSIIFSLVIMDVVFAAYSTYTQRGMASKSVFLFVIPIITAAVSQSRSAILATASLCVAGYSLATVRYFYEHYGEGFRVELYGEIFLYSALFFIIALMLLVVVRPNPDSA